MSDFANVIRSLIDTAAFIGSLWWANAAIQQLALARRFSLSGGIRLLVVLALGSLIFGAVSHILNGFFALFATYYSGGVKAVEVIGALAVLGFVGWLYSRALLDR